MFKPCTGIWLARPPASDASRVMRAGSCFSSPNEKTCTLPILPLGSENEGAPPFIVDSPAADPVGRITPDGNGFETGLLMVSPLFSVPTYGVIWLNPLLVA